MMPHPDLSSAAVSQRLLDAHIEQQRRELLGEMLAKFRRDNPQATEREIDAYVDQVTREIER
jgi:hypothetical protein